QMVSEVGAENNSTTIILMPSDFISVANGATKAFNGLDNLLKSKFFSEPQLEAQKRPVEDKLEVQEKTFLAK
ncbi:MAG: hypothetical protein FD167_5319, partial [bacterium]